MQWRQVSWWKVESRWWLLVMLWDERLSCLFLLSHPYFLAVLSLTGFPSSTWLCHLYGYRCHFIHILCILQAIHFCKKLFNEKNRPLNDDTAIFGQLLRIPQNDLSVEEVINTIAINIIMMASFLLPSNHPPGGVVFNRFLTSQYNQQHKRQV